MGRRRPRHHQGRRLAGHAGQVRLALLLRFNSPGGVASGVPELAAWLAAQTAKPVYAYADGLCASAAYYLAAATGRVYAPATATVGSIGVICRHMDWSGFLEKCGVRVTHLTGGAHGRPWATTPSR